MQDVLKHQEYERSDSAGSRFDQHQQPEPERQHEQQVDVTSRDDLVDSKLHVERPRKDKRLKDDRQQQNLHESVAASAEMTPEYGQRQPRPLVLNRKFLTRNELE